VFFASGTITQINVTVRVSHTPLLIALFPFTVQSDVDAAWQSGGTTSSRPAGRYAVTIQSSGVSRQTLKYSLAVD
jgi:hypothetical protein